MRLDYDIELNILNDIHDLGKKEIFIFSDDECSKNYYNTAKIIDDILEDDYLKKWVDNSKSQFPPDFINEEDGLIMEVMRIDDHSPNGKYNPNLSRQREMRNEVEGIKDMFPNAKRFIMNAVTTLPTDEDHNYTFYYTSFQRTIRKHLSKLESYKRNHPKKKVIFLVVDETSGIYFEACTRDDNHAIGRPHQVYLDRRFLNEFVDSDLDYLMLFCPFNYFKTVDGMTSLAHLTIFDVKNMKNNSFYKPIDYDISRMISSEK